MKVHSMLNEVRYCVCYEVPKWFLISQNDWVSKAKFSLWIHGRRVKWPPLCDIVLQSNNYILGNKLVLGQDNVIGLVVLTAKVTKRKFWIKIDFFSQMKRFKQLKKLTFVFVMLVKHYAGQNSNQNSKMFRIRNTSSFVSESLLLHRMKEITYF